MSILQEYLGTFLKASSWKRANRCMSMNDHSLHHRCCSSPSSWFLSGLHYYHLQPKPKQTMTTLLLLLLFLQSLLFLPSILLAAIAARLRDGRLSTSSLFRSLRRKINLVSLIHPSSFRVEVKSNRRGWILRGWFHSRSSSVQFSCIRSANPFSIIDAYLYVILLSTLYCL